MVVKKTGALTVELANGISLVVNPSDEYEAWQLACAGKFLLVCGPNGVALFTENRSTI